MQPSADAQAQPPADAQGNPPDVRGLADAISQDRLYGWAFDAANPGARLKVELRLDGQTLATTTADLPRPDLAKNGIGDGCHAFEFAVTPQQMARHAGFSLVATAGGRSFPVAMRFRQPQPQQAGAAPAAGVAVQAQVAETRRMREELTALTQRVAALPDAATMRTILEQNAALAEQLRQGLGALDQRLAALPDNTLMRQAVQQQGLLAERLEGMEIWLTRLERRLAEAPAPAAPEPNRRPEPMPMLLFGALGVAFLVAVLVGLALRYL